MKITCDKAHVDFNLMFDNIKGYDGSPLAIIVWKMPERRNIKREYWNKYGVQRVYGDYYKWNHTSLSSIPKDYHHAIIFALFQFNNFERSEYFNIKDHSMKRPI